MDISTVKTVCQQKKKNLVFITKKPDSERVFHTIKRIFEHKKNGNTTCFAVLFGLFDFFKQFCGIAWNCTKLCHHVIAESNRPVEADTNGLS